MISTHHGVTFHALVVSSLGHYFELNFILAHCVCALLIFFNLSFGPGQLCTVHIYVDDPKGLSASRLNHCFFQGMVAN